MASKNTGEKIERRLRRSSKLVEKISYIAPCTQADIDYWFKRNTLICSVLLIVFILLIYAALNRDTQLNRFRELSLFFESDTGVFNLIEFIWKHFFGELLLCFFTHLWIKKLFGFCPINIVGDKGIAFLFVRRNYTIIGGNIALFESVNKMEVSVARGGIGKLYKWYGDSRISAFSYYYHPFFENKSFINAVLESWYQYKILKEYRIK